uniref:Family with sequence similarity 168 member A n=1 Tax=Astyanax mexicanus TaxID=7994 RepID=A0A8B9KNK1_ASTMX
FSLHHFIPATTALVRPAFSSPVFFKSIIARCSSVHSEGSDSSFCVSSGYPGGYPTAAPAYTPSLYQTGSPGYPPGEYTHTLTYYPFTLKPTLWTPDPYFSFSLKKKNAAMFRHKKMFCTSSLFGAYYTQPVYAAQPHVIHHTTVVQPNSIPSAIYPAPVAAPRPNGVAMGMVAGTTMAMSAGTLLTTPQHTPIGPHPVTVPTYRPQGTPGYSYVPPHW